MYFCNKKFDLITERTNRDLYRNIKFELKNNFNISYHEKHHDLQLTHNINFSDYLITTKDENVLYLLLITINNIKYSLFYNNTLTEFYSVKIRFHKSLYNGTLIRGNIFKNKSECWIFYLSDIYFYKSSYINKNKLSNRIKILANIIKNEYVFDDFMNSCHLQLKSYFLLNHLEFINKENEFLFIPEYNNMKTYYIKIGREIKKEKQLDDGLKYRSFKIINTNIPDVYELFDNKKFHSIACVAKFATSTMLKSLFKNNELNKDIIVKCEYSKNFNAWVPIE